MKTNIIAAIIMALMLISATAGNCEEKPVEQAKQQIVETRMFCSGKQWIDTAIVTSINGRDELLIPTESEFFKDMSISASLSSSGDTLAITAPGGDAFFEKSSPKGNPETTFTRTPEGNMFVPLRKLAEMLHIRIDAFSRNDENEGYTIRLRPEITRIAEKRSESGRSLSIELSLGVNITQEEDERDHITLFLEEACLGGKSQINPGDIQTETSESEGGVRIKAFFPKNRKGFSAKQTFASKTGIEFLPDFNLAGGYVEESLKSIKFSENEITLKASGPFRYFWNVRKAGDRESILIEMPMLSKDTDITVPEGLRDKIKTDYTASSYGVLSIEVNNGGRFSSSSPDGRTLVIKTGENEMRVPSDSGIGVTGMPEKSIVIVIDPGHGGGDYGACNKAIGVSEKISNMELAKELGDWLTGYGYKVIYTRTTDRDVSWAGSPDAAELQARADIGNANSASIFVSVHCNASVNKNAKGFAVYWTKKEDLALASCFDDVELSPSTGVKNKGAIHGNYYVLRKTSMPAIIVETLFISNDDEAKKLKDKKFRNTIMGDVAGVLNKYLSKNFMP